MQGFRIKKRNGVIVNYDGEKIINAILKAMIETDKGVDLELAEKIEQEVAEMAFEKNVEEIQNFIEEALSRHGRFDVAKKYVLYRAHREELRKLKKDGEKYKLLSKSFLSRYKHKNPPMTQLGDLVYYRTYSRYLPDEKRREYWWETVARAVDYNCSLTPTTREEAEQLFDNVFNLRQFLSGRTFWVGGTDVAYKYPMANYNCSFQVINEIESFKDIFYLLMIGSGAGVRILKDDVKQIPRIRTDIQVFHLEYAPVKKEHRVDSTSMDFSNDSVEITVGDSKEGWVQALDFYLKIISSNEYKNIDTIIFNYNHVRAQGEKLKTFGGTASGHGALLKMFKKIEQVLSKYQSPHKLKPIDCLDIANAIGEGVVVGGVRRTSEIALVDTDDEECITAKENLYSIQDGKWIPNEDLLHRQMSNNSIFYKKKPSRERLKWQIEKMRYSGEPGFANEEAAAKRRINFFGLNPCAEILLNNKGLCNLTTVNVFAFVVNGKLRIQDLLAAQRLSARASYRMTNVELELPKWDKVQREERLTGCSLTGWQDMVNATGLTLEEQGRILDMLREVAHEEVEKIANQIGENKSLLVTTVKPEGTLSQLPTVSSGVHYSHSPYYVRRVRINAHDPIVKVCEELNYRILPEVGQSEENCTTKVIEFPVKAPDGLTKYDIGAIQQLENYKLFMTHYVDHNASITVHVRENEWDAVEQWVWDNWDDIVAVSFLPLEDSFYQLMPYEAIEKEEYEIRLAEIQGKYITPERIAKYETFDETIEIGNEACDTGACPVR